MDKIKYYIENKKLFILIPILVFLLIILILLFSKSESKESIEVIKEEKTEKNVSTSTIKVDIKGYVENPGVYELEENSRVIDALELAGGLKEDANTEYINLSKKLSDEMIIIIYSNGEVDKFKEVEKQIVYIKEECKCPDNINDACINTLDKVNTNENSNNTLNELISINTNSIEELTKLDGIGESKAKAIIEYRKQNGDFKDLEDIMNVSGIGESAYSKIKDSIKL